MDEAVALIEEYNLKTFADLTQAGNEYPFQAISDLPSSGDVFPLQGEYGSYIYCPMPSKKNAVWAFQTKEALDAFVLAVGTGKTKLTAAHITSDPVSTSPDEAEVDEWGEPIIKPKNEEFDLW